jgi:ketosteroid isomerase-like protein
MSATETRSVRELVDELLEAITAINMDAALALFAEDGHLLDPHYPLQHMKGKAEIRDGLSWGFKSMKSFGFTIEKFFPGEDGQSAAIETACSHVLSTGKKLNFPQAFIFEFKDGLITRLQAYEPYPPGGIVGLFLGANRLIKKIKK